MRTFFICISESVCVCVCLSREPTCLDTNQYGWLKAYHIKTSCDSAWKLELAGTTQASISAHLPPSLDNSHLVKYIVYFICTSHNFTHKYSQSTPFIPAKNSKALEGFCLSLDICSP